MLCTQIIFKISQFVNFEWVFLLFLPEMHSFIELLEQFEFFLKSQNFPNQPANLYDPCKHIISIGGKRIRPVSVMMAHQLFNDINKNTLHAAAAIEYFHNFTLIHDDIMDNSPTRRGEPTVHEKWNLPIAILSGDVMNIFAYQQLAQLPANLLKEVLQIFNTTAIEVCEGQQLDMDFEQKEKVTIDDYIHMITLKTSVLLAASLKIGAITSGASISTANMLYEFGKNIGISFQLKDDYLDAFGESNKTGKQVGGDIKANKKTFLLLKAFEKANSDQKLKLEELLQNDNENKVNGVLGIFEELGIREEAAAIKQHYSNIAFDILEKLPVLSSRKSELKSLAEMLLVREN